MKPELVKFNFKNCQSSQYYLLQLRVENLLERARHLRDVLSIWMISTTSYPYRPRPLSYPLLFQKLPPARRRSMRIWKYSGMYFGNHVIYVLSLSRSKKRVALDDLLEDDEVRPIHSCVTWSLWGSQSIIILLLEFTTSSTKVWACAATKDLRTTISF